jgi:lipid-A-disaccharide synthase
MVLLGKPFIRVKNYAMVNIIAGREIMPELYQHKGKPQLLAREAIAILKENRLPAMRESLAEVRRRLGEPGASRRAAQAVLDSL